MGRFQRQRIATRAFWAESTWKCPEPHETEIRLRSTSYNATTKAFSARYYVAVQLYEIIVTDEEDGAREFVNILRRDTECNETCIDSFLKWWTA